PFKYEDEPGGTRYPQLSADPADIRDFRPKLSPRLARIVSTAMQREPAARFQGCIDFQRAIERYRRQQQIRRTWLPALAALSVVAVVAAVVNWQWKLKVEQEAEAKRREAERIALVEKQENQARARKAIEGLIVGGVKQLGSLCREEQNRQARLKLLRTSESEGFKDLAEKFRKQVQQIEQNMADYSNGYSSTLSQLTRFDAAMVDEQIGAHPPQDAESGAWLSPLRADYAAAASRGVPDMDALLKRCK
ncbi:MAG TPA: hypothetical protein PLB26_15715, partial [Rubrivivax sp.]|nr:hypothetical protein [Rubrivivax sp.]